MSKKQNESDKNSDGTESPIPPSPVVAEHNPGERDDAGVGLRINALDLSRATEGAAIVLSIAMGRGNRTGTLSTGEAQPRPEADQPAKPVKMYANSARPWAENALIGFLRQSYCRPSICHLDHGSNPSSSDPESEALMSWTERKTTREVEVPDSPEFKMDFALSPVDGVHGLLDGRDSGAISVVAMGPEGTFTKNISEFDNDPAVQYLVITANPEVLHSTDGDGSYQALLASAARSLFAASADAGTMTKSISVPEFLACCGILTRIFERAGELSSEPTMGCLSDGDNGLAMHSLLSGQFRLRKFVGSSVAAAMAPFMPRSGVHAFIGIARKTHVVLIAAAARAMRAPVFAFPVGFKTVVRASPPRKSKDEGGEKPKKPRTERVPHVLKTIPISGDRIVLGSQVVVVATGITENLILRGVRYLPGHRCLTHTLVLSGYTGSRRSILTEHDLSMEKLRWGNGKLRLAIELIEELKQQVDRKWPVAVSTRKASPSGSTRKALDLRA